MKRVALMLAVVTVAAACSSSSDSSETVSASQSTVASTESAGTSHPNAESSSTSIGDDGATLVPNQTIAPEATTPDGPSAPDFTLALGDGTSFSLSEESKPVYMIFWADW
jgi:hypothetical protein